jgi:hypothetical protein
MASKVTSTKWAPDMGIPGNSSGVFSFTISAPLYVKNSFTGQKTLYQAGSHRISVVRTPPSTAAVSQVFQFFDGTKVVWTYVIRMLGHPLLGARFIFANTWNGSSIIKSSEGTFNAVGLGINSISIPLLGLPTIDFPANAKISVPLTLPSELTRIVRGNGAFTYFELFVVMNAVVNGTQKSVNTKLVFA